MNELTIDEHLDELVMLNMLKHTRVHEMVIGNHLIAVKKHIKEQTEVIAEVKEACTEAIKDPNWYDRIPGGVLYADIRLTKTAIEKIGATDE